MPRTRDDKARAIAQVEADGAVPVHELSLMAGADERSLVRWIRDGRAGVHLNGICRAGKWFTSRQAVARFLAECARLEEQLELQAAELRRRGVAAGDVTAGLSDGLRARVMSGARPAAAARRA